MTRLYDSLFAGVAGSMSGGDREHARPRYVRWRRDGAPGLFSWHTDGHLASESQAPVRVKWLLEPRDNHPENFTSQALEGFDVIYTHDPMILSCDDRARMFPLGGTRIHESDWGAEAKNFSRLPSIVASPKRGLPGHRLRHDLIAATGRVDAFGPEYRPIRRKFDALHYSRFHVAIEPVQSECYFSEHLLDPILTMNVPIYWGASRETLAMMGFNLDGIIFANHLESLRAAVEELAKERVRQDEWQRRRYALIHNLRVGLCYTMPEDWLYRRDPDLFEEGD